MEFSEYQFEGEHLSGYAQLIRDVYAGQPLFAEARVADMQRALCQDNPFLRFGTWRSFLLRDKGRPAAHISAIIDSRLPPGIGLVGFFDSINDSAFANEAFRLAVEFLAIKGVRFVRGPVDLTTWKGFRVSYPERHPPFLLEPFTRGYYRDLFKGYGFTVAQNNISTIGAIDRADVRRFEASYEELQKQGWVFERVEARDLLGLLPGIWQISTETFKESWSFVPVSAEEFLYNFGMSGNPSLFVDIAREEQNKVVAFSLSARDGFAGDRKRVVVKTLGALPGYQKSGVGRALLYMVHARAKQEGMDEVIFSTMRSDNAFELKL
jgi:GNAT superfamily N-acetyltransferase